MNQYMPNYLKTKNRMMIYELVRANQTTSRAELVRMTGMSFPTVLKVVDKMLELGIIVESDEMETPSGAGRRGHLLCFNARSYYAIGIEFEGKIATIGLVDLLGECSHTRSFTLTEQKQHFNLEKLNHEVHALLDIAENEQIPVLGIGIGFPAMVNAEHNTVTRLSSMEIYKETPFRAIFPEFYAGIELPVFVDNEVNYACKGEAFLRRPDSSCRSLLYITLGTGCGAGLMLDGRLWYGSGHKSGEIGQILSSPADLRMSSDSKPIAFEKLINIDALLERFGVNFKENPVLSEALRSEIIDYLCPYLAYAITNIVYLLDINQCALTGIIPLSLGDALLDRLQKLLNKVMLSNTVQVSSAANKNTGIVGAGVTVFERCLEDMFRE